MGALDSSTCTVDCRPAMVLVLVPVRALALVLAAGSGRWLPAPISQQRLARPLGSKARKGLSMGKT
jgi:hypothetical protein